MAAASFHATIGNYQLPAAATASISRAYLNASSSPASSTLICLLLGYPMAYGIARAPRALAQAAADAGHPAVLDQLPDPRLRLDRHPQERRPASTRCCSARPDRTSRWRCSTPTSPSISASSTPICRSWCCRSTRCSRSTTRRCSRRRPISAAGRAQAFWRVTLPLSLPGIVAGCAAGLHPGGRRVRHPRSARRLRHADDRQGAVGRVLHQPRLAGGLGRGDRHAGAAGGADGADAPPVARARRA